MMDEPGPERCCTTMLTMSTPHDELVARLIRDGVLTGEEAATLSPMEPLIEWRPHIGMFCIAHVAIFHCPWCGARLPDQPPHAPPSSVTRPMQIFIGPNGKVDAFIDGKPAPAEVTKLLFDNDDGPAG